MIINASYPIGGGYQVIRSWPDVADVASVSLDVSDIDWEKWMDVFLEIEPTVMKQVYLRADDNSTSGNYRDYNSNKQAHLGMYGSSMGAESDAEPLRIALKVGRIQDTAYFYVVACYREPWISDYGGNVSMGGTDSLSNHAYRTYGKWCTMQTLNLATSSVTSMLSWTNIRLIGMKRP